MLIPAFPELVLIFAVLVLLFGANKLPKLGGAIGESIRNFKDGLKGTTGKEPEKIEASEKQPRNDESDRKL